MRKLPTILAFGFIVITLFRVAQFAEGRMYAGLLGWLFSVALGAGVYLFSYYTRDNITRQDGATDKRDRNVKVWSWIALVFFMVVDGAFNCLEVWLSVNPATDEMKAATGLYGVFPTVAAALLGALQGHIDRLPTPPAKATTNVFGAIRRALVAKIDKWAQPDTQPEPKQAATREEEPATTAYQEATLSAKTRIRLLHGAHPELSHAQIAKETGTSRQYVDKVLAEWKH